MGRRAFVRSSTSTSHHPLKSIRVNVAVVAWESAALINPNVGVLSTLGPDSTIAELNDEIVERLRPLDALCSYGPRSQGTAR